MIKAIETIYSGYRFRSRIEARWAVFFNALGVKWEYEKEGYDLDGIWYLPDFWLPEQKCWVEIKGQEPTQEDEEKCARLQAHSGNKVHLFFGDIPGTIYTCRVNPDAEIPPCAIGEDHGWCECPFCGKVEIVQDSDVFCMSCKCASKCFNDRQMLDILNETYQDNIPDFIYNKLFEWGNTPRIEAAYTAARQARFEHGERSQTAYWQGYLGQLEAV